MLVVNQYPFQASRFEANYFRKISKIRWSECWNISAWEIALAHSLFHQLVQQQVDVNINFSIEAIPQAVAYKQFSLDGPAGTNINPTMCT